MGDKSITKPHAFFLANALNLYFQIGYKTFTRDELLAYGGMDRRCVEHCLEAWQTRGLLQVYKPVAEAEDEEIIAELFHPIEESCISLTRNPVASNLMLEHN